MAIVFIQDIFRLVGIGTVLAGRIEEGTLRVGMKFNANGKMLEVKYIERRGHEQVKEANQGDIVGIAVRLIRNEGLIKSILAGSDPEYNIVRDYREKRVEFI